MRNNKGFSLTEVLVAVMIVGLIGIALASLTVSASRESAAGRSKVMLRNNMSLFMRTLRDDINAATYIEGGNASPAGTGVILKVCDDRTLLGTGISSVNGMGCVTYKFEKGSDTANIVPENSTRGGKITRNDEVVLNNVKYVNSNGYVSPSFKRVGNDTTGSALDVAIITELNSTPVVNEVMEETFLLPNGL